MRIRKHARLLAPSTSPSPTVPNSPDTHVCQLNRSPWDVFTFTQILEHQIKMEDEYTCNRVGRESVYDPESEEDRFGFDTISSKEEFEEEEEDYAPYVKKKGKKKIGGKRDIDYVQCGKIDGKGWQCKKEAKEGELLCEHHLIQLETYKHRYNYSYNNRKAKTVASKIAKTVVAANKKRKRVRISSASAMGFYYYSGFGPSYAVGRRRMTKNETVKEDEDVVDNATDQASPSLVSSDGVHDKENQVSKTETRDSLDDDDESDDERDGYGGKKRVRKPIKERSLKSLF